MCAKQSMWGEPHELVLERESEALTVSINIHHRTFAHVKELL
jgi:hypothetical protein